MSGLITFYLLRDAVTYVSDVCGLQVSSGDGAQQVGKISKQWSGFVKEYFTDADNFGVSCKSESTASALLCVR